jgi:hypothetical protein
VDRQRAALLSWKAAVAEAVAAGWSKGETQARVKFPKLGPVDIGQKYMLEYVETLNAGSLFDMFSARRDAPCPAAYLSTSCAEAASHPAGCD